MHFQYRNGDFWVDWGYPLSCALDPPVPLNVGEDHPKSEAFMVALYDGMFWYPPDHFKRLHVLEKGEARHLVLRQKIPARE